MAGMGGFDMSGMQALLQSPEIQNAIAQIQNDPQMMEMVQQMGAAYGGMPGMPGAAGANGAAARDGPAAGGQQAPDPAQFQQMMEQLQSNPQMTQMMASLGEKMLESNPQFMGMMQAMQDPESQEKMKAKVEELKEDPETADIFAEMEAGGMEAWQRIMQDEDKMRRLGKAFEGFGLDGLNFGQLMGAGAGGMGAAAAAGGEGEGEEDGDEDDDEEAVDSEFIQAAMDGDLDKVKQLVADSGAGFSIDEQDATGHTALHYACGYGEPEIVEHLLAHGASVTAVDDDKNTPLHYAAGYGQLPCVKALLEHGAGLTDKNTDGKTALEVAQLNEHDEIVALLKEHESEAYL